VGGSGSIWSTVREAFDASVNVVAVDVDDTKLSIVKELGADIIVNSKTEDAVEKVRKLQTTKVHRE
jgi:propanol-preferring alcohol dehydrogenase